MSDLFSLGDARMVRLRPYFLKPHGSSRVDDQHV